MRKKSDIDSFNCIICKEDRNYFSLGICDHRKVCNYCSLRSRILYKDKKCPICTTKLEEIFIFEWNEDPIYSEELKNKDDFYKDDGFKDNGIYYASISAHEEALKLKSYICPIKSCQDGAYDNLQTLCTHLNKVHKRYYCEICLKEAKRFLSETPLFTLETLNEHIWYGEYSDKGSLDVPPHTVCGFCNIKFYNDESLFKHMNEFHFVCQLCRDKKNIIFYKEIDQLLDHNKFIHYMCPYQECIDDIFVVFDSEEKLNSHFITKHKCIDAQNKMAKFMFGDGKSKTKPSSFNLNNRNIEFNFSEYVNELKERVNEYKKNFQIRKEISNTTSSSNQRYQNSYNNYNENYYDHSYNNNYDINNQGRVKRGRGKRYNEGFQQNNYYENYDNEPVYPPQQRNIKNNNGGKLNKKNQHHNEEKQNSISTDIPTKFVPAKIDYSFVFNNFSKILKEFIVKIIRDNHPKEEEFIIPKETIYQLVIIIDKLDNDKLLELASLSNFGIDLDIYKELKNIMAERIFDENNVYKFLFKMEIKKLLIVYKYVSTAAKKIDGIFYKLELEQIDEDMYDDFAVREKRYKKAAINSKKENKPIPGMNEYGTKKIKMDDRNFPLLLNNSSQVSGQRKGGEGKLMSIFTNSKIDDNKIKQEVKSELKDEINTNTLKPQSKLAMALDGKIIPKEKPKKTKWGDKKLKMDNYDDEFPEL